MAAITSHPKRGRDQIIRENQPSMKCAFDFSLRFFWGGCFYYKRKKNSNSSGILTKEGNNFTLREQTPRYKITTVWTPDLSHLLQSRDGEETAEANKQFCKTKT